MSPFAPMQKISSRSLLVFISLLMFVPSESKAQNFVTGSQDISQHSNDPLEQLKKQLRVLQKSSVTIKTAVHEGQSKAIEVRGQDAQAEEKNLQKRRVWMGEKTIELYTLKKELDLKFQLLKKQQEEFYREKQAFQAERIHWQDQNKKDAEKVAAQAQALEELKLREKMSQIAAAKNELRVQQEEFSKLKSSWESAKRKDHQEWTRREEEFKKKESEMASAQSKLNEPRQQKIQSEREFQIQKVLLEQKTRQLERESQRYLKRSKDLNKSQLDWERQWRRREKALVDHEMRVDRSRHQLYGYIQRLREYTSLGQS